MRECNADLRGTMVTLRSIAFNFAFYVLFFVLMIVGLPCLLLPRRFGMVLVRTWARASLAMLGAICGMRVEFRRLDLMPRGGAVLAVKHQSFLETIALVTVVEDFAYVLKKELANIPFFGWYVRATGQIALDRGLGAGALPRLQKLVREKLALERQVIIFPEGTRRPVGVAPVYKSGVAALCATSRVPCTPVAVNTGLFWPRHSFKRRPGTVVIEFLPPIAPGLDKREFMRALTNAIEPATNALVAEALAANPRLDADLAKGAAPLPT